MKAVIVSLIAVGALAMSACAARNKAQASLKVGDPAPAIKVGKWIQGDAVTAFEKGKVYVVEFWATWCPPCRKSIPHLTEVQKKYQDKGVVVIGVDLGEDEATVAPFVKQMGDKMTYRVALDDASVKDGAMNAAWMEAAGQGGIPTAFVVGKDGKLAWVGHPMDGLEKALDKAVAAN